MYLLAFWNAIYLLPSPKKTCQRHCKEELMGKITAVNGTVWNTDDGGNVEPDGAQWPALFETKGYEVRYCKLHCIHFILLT